MIDECKVHGMVLTEGVLSGMVDGTDECGIYGIVRTEDTLSGIVVSTDEIHGQVSAVGVLIGSVGFPKCAWPDDYEGDYEVTPHTYAQTLDTDYKYLKEDVKVLAIPYYETSNVNGTTVYISDES